MICHALLWHVYVQLLSLWSQNVHFQSAAETAVLPCSKHLQCIYVDRDFKKGDIMVCCSLLPVAGVHLFNA